MMQLNPISGEVERGRAPESVCAFRRSDGRVFTWRDFAAAVAKVRLAIRGRDADSWILFCDDSFAFGVAFSALLREGKEILLPGGVQDQLVAQIGGGRGFLIGDGAFSAAAGPSLDIRPLVEDRTDFAEAGELGDSRTASARLRLFTSGSTGGPKAVPKRLDQIEAEIENLFALWAGLLAGRVLYSTVSHQHIYGFLFYGLLPLCSGTVFCSERLIYPESMAELGKQDSALVASPAFLKRWIESGATELPEGRSVPSFSSGGVLPEALGREAGRLFRCPVLEIYGSSETGGITYRHSATSEHWKAFEGIDLRIAEDGRIQVRSPYLAETGFITIDDLGELAEDGSLHLLGRADSVVKIEEKRVSLRELESWLLKSAFVKEAQVLALDVSGRQLLAAALVPTDSGWDFLLAQGRRAMVMALKEELGKYFAAILLPRKWRFIPAMPVNEQGKIPRADLLTLFEGREAPYDVMGLEKTGDCLQMDLAFPPECPYFEGHFESFKILPAVAQIDIVMRLAARQFGSSLDMRGMPRVKFMKPMSPHLVYHLDLRYESARSRIEFTYSEKAGSAPCSSGKIDVGVL